MHYLNPRLIVGCLPVYRKRILMCRRAIEPRLGLWTLPAGFLESGESVEAGAVRETREEAGAEAQLLRAHSLYSVPHIAQVHLIFLAKLAGGRFAASTSESLEVRLFSESEIPWDEIAFSSMKYSLLRYLEDRETTILHLSAYPECAVDET